MDKTQLSLDKRRFGLLLAGVASLALLNGCGGAEAADESIDQVVQRLQAQELEKTQIAFNGNRTAAQVDRFIGFYDPAFRSINLTPMGVMQSGYAELRPQVQSFPTVPFTMTLMRAVRNNESSVVLTYRMDIMTPGGQLAYLATSMWSRNAAGLWLTVFYQATPLM